jgi:hypothetical protein
LQSLLPLLLLLLLLALLTLLLLATATAATAGCCLHYYDSCQLVLELVAAWSDSSATATTAATAVGAVTDEH